MAKTKISEYDSTAANNTDIDSINIAEGMAPSNVNNAIRQLMAHLKTEFFKTGSNNTSLGDTALDSLDGSSPGGDNTAIGSGAGTAITTGDQNTLIGKVAGTAITTGDDNVAVGAFSLNSNTTASDNTALGYSALEKNTTGDSNTAVGYKALEANTTASNNTAIGFTAFGSNTTGNKTVAVGDSALASSTTASDSVAVGFEALQSETTGSRSTAVGYQALKTQNVGSTTQNTAVGYGAGLDVTTAINSTFVGGDAGANVTTGNKNTMLGDGAGVQITTGSSHTVLGRHSGNAGNLDIRTGTKHVVLSDGDGLPRGFCDSQGAWRFTSDNAAYVGGHTHTFAHDNNDTQAFIINNQHGAFVSALLDLRCDRAATSGYDLLHARSGGTADSEFIVRGDGNALCDGSFSGGGADYAEYFEWSDGNSDSQDRTGYTVVLDGNKIKLATSDDAAANVIGAVSANPSVVGDSDIERWKGKYLLNDFGAYQTEEYTETWWIDENNVKHSYNTDKIPDDVTVPDDATVDTKDANDNTLIRRKLNPDYDADQAYVSREDRKEWATIGMMGKLRIRKGQPTGDRWIKMRDISDNVEEWLVR